MRASILPHSLHSWSIGMLILSVLSKSVVRVHGFSPLKTLSSASFPSTSQYIYCQSRHHEVCSKLYMSTNSKNEESSSRNMNKKYTFESIGLSNPVLLNRLKNNLQYTTPTDVQIDTFQQVLLLKNGESNNDSGKKRFSNDITIGAETGSGKTLAYLLPIIHDILERKKQALSHESDYNNIGYDYARALILVPNKELVNQVVRMAVPLCCDSGNGNDCIVWGKSSIFDNNDNNNNAFPSPQSETNNNNNDPSTIVRLATMPGGLLDPMDFKPFRDAFQNPNSVAPVDILISTPAAVGPFGLKPKNIEFFADIETVVIDEADMLLDGGYIRQLENVLMGFKRADRLDISSLIGASSSQEYNENNDDGDDFLNNKNNNKKTQHVFVAATLPDFGLRSVNAYIERKFPYATKITMNTMHKARHSGLSKNNPTLWIEQDSKKARMQQLVDMLQNDESLQNEKIMIFLNTVQDVEGVHEALTQAGITRVVPFHAKIKLSDRTNYLQKFQKYNKDKNNKDDDDAARILLCTDLAARGLDVPGVNVVIQLQFAGNVVSHLHRMGRCGRVGSERNGRGIIFYSSQERELVQVVQDAEHEQDQMILHGDVQEEESLIEEKSSTTRNDNNNNLETGTVKNAFSRKRGFTKKRKKMKREEYYNGTV